MAVVTEQLMAVAEKIHPLMGPIFTSRPSSDAVGSQCSLCLEAGASDTAIIDRHGRTRYVCLSHELMLHFAFMPDASGQNGTDRYQAYVLGHIMQDADRPFWMPRWAYRKLTKRAAAKARLLALVVTLGMGNPLRYPDTTPN